MNKSKKALVKVGFLCAHNPYDRNSFSGTAYYAYHALKEAHDTGILDKLDLIIDHKVPNSFHKIHSRLRKIFGISSSKMGSETRDVSDFDFVVSLVSTGHALELKRKHDVTLIHVTDATPQFLRDFYGHTVPDESVAAEAELIELADRIIYSSEYMMERAISEFGKKYRNKISFVPFGVNLDHLPTSYRRANSNPMNPILQILFIGKEWERKGGPLAVEILNSLQSFGVDARLTIIGCNPQIDRLCNKITTYEFLNKNVAKDRSKLEDIFEESHLLVLPTRADCTPMVIAEANAHSIPTVVTDTGGIGSLVDEGKNGFLIPMDADHVFWARKILEITKEPLQYEIYREAAFHSYISKLNWNSWVENLLEESKKAIQTK